MVETGSTMETKTTGNCSSTVSVRHNNYHDNVLPNVHVRKLITGLQI